MIILGDFNIATNEERIQERTEELEQAQKEYMKLTNNRGEIDKNRMDTLIKTKGIKNVVRDTIRSINLTNFFARLAWLLKFMFDSGYTDAVSWEIPTYHYRDNNHWKGTTVDHVLVSPALEGRVTAEVKSNLELSDHDVIIVDIKERKE